MTGEGRSAFVPRARDCLLKDGEVGDALGERRRAKDEIGVQEASLSFRRSMTSPRERRTGRGGTGGIESALLLLPEERREPED